MMTNRYEYKFLVPNDALDEIRAQVAPYVIVDHHAQEREPQEYTVRSVYLDTRSFTFYREKMAGIRIRKKLRIRAYNKPESQSKAFLEIKRKDGMFISKNRAPLFYKNLDALFKSQDLDQYILTANDKPVKKDDAKKFFFHYHRQGLAPKVLVVYDREAFFSKFDARFRLTFDKNLRSSLVENFDIFLNETALKPALPQHFIFEAKFFGKLPAWFSQLLRQYELQRMALSKYVICLDSQKSAGQKPMTHTFRNHANGC